MIATLVEKKPETNDVISFLFKAGGIFTYLPGQYLYITLPKLKFPDSRGSTRHFTISSSPTEKNILSFTTKIRQESGFKRSLAELSLGEEVEVEGPTGTLILDEHEKGTHILIAGGIGVTPFRSFIKYNIDKSLTDINLYLLNSVTTPDDIIFKKDFDDWGNHTNIKINITVTKPEESKTKWTGLVGRIDSDMINSLYANYNLQATTFWLCGPPALVTAMESILRSMNIKGNKIRTEKFTGY
ncbi:MAG: Oxidoreductase, 2Fe-2S and FAD/NAD(P) binding domain protein [Candidatus Woesebacteria bacterium GW2011_GWA1_37_7]|uniref:Oxidoreductase, 2Fe-2S and FAD/NAD(P) binding domain protein n=1 Tax=Candidatus Woesebacteria bacterium GW2011_GWA1_37_7 TaxID=1618545 RepID=A0A0G0K553_9BACT|nr:MAG: Oxidoreductase, 2Fe-2S and FAD/NAD(P) binding domain protein [Candidatus Woesebacteria bacterium GW2011_GWA1_37_7]